LDLVKADHTGNTVSNADDCSEFLHVVLSCCGDTSWMIPEIFFRITLEVSAVLGLREANGCWLNRNKALNILVEK
jgi:hypothetical protein